MTGVGTSGGAASAINAFATGRGAAFGLALDVACLADEADTWQVYAGRQRLSPTEARLAMTTAKTFGADRPLRLRIRSDIPAKKGLKSSSAVAVAVGRAVMDLHQKTMSTQRILSRVAKASLDSKTSLTGAFDDAAACLLGGLVLCDNLKRRILRRLPLPSRHVAALHIPSRTLETGALDRATFRPIAPLVEAAWRTLERGHLREAMLANTFAYAPLLGHKPRFTLQALALGATAAGLSGKGPAEVALVPRDLMRRFQKAHPRLRFVPLGGPA